MSGQQTGIVTPEAVRLEFEGASLGSRAPALLIDLLIQTVVYLSILLAGAGLSGALGQMPEWAGITLVVLLTFTVFWGYPVAFETVWRGRTPGKAAMGLRVVTREGAPIRFRHGAIRAAFSLLDIYGTAGAAGVVSILATQRHQRLGDLVAGTLVLRERAAGPPMAPVTFSVPAGAEGYATSVDPAGLTEDDYATIRSFLLRASSLSAEARTRLGTTLAQRLAARLSHVPPPDVSPELFLMVAAARYQQRFERREPRPGSAPPSTVPPARLREGSQAPPDWQPPARQPSGSATSRDGFTPPG